jgi:hypothetical protein
LATGGDAFWWAAVTITTAGYGDRHPTTAVVAEGSGIIGAPASLLVTRIRGVGAAPPAGPGLARRHGGALALSGAAPSLSLDQTSEPLEVPLVFVLRPGGGLLAAVLASVLALPPAQAPASATFGWGEVYELPAGTVVPKDLYVVADEATIDGTVEGDVVVIARRVRLGGTVKGHTNIVAARIEITGRPLGIVRTVGAAQIIPPSPLPGPAAPGAPLPVPTATPAATAARFTTLAFGAAPAPAPPSARPQPRPRPVVSWWQTTGTGQLLLGFAALSALLLWRAPGALVRPARAIAAHPWRTLLIGLLAAQLSVLLPLATGALVVLMGVFWGWFPAVLLAAALAAGLGLLWVLSPLVTGVWLGRRLGPLLGRGPDSPPVLVGGVLLLGLLGQLPRFGWLVYLASFLLALGALLGLAAPARPARAPAPALEPLPPAPAPESLPEALAPPRPPAPAPALEPLPAASAPGDAPAATALPAPGPASPAATAAPAIPADAPAPPPARSPAATEGTAPTSR